MEHKNKQEGIHGKRSSLNSYLTTYFRNKFGMKDLAEEAESSFREALDYYLVETKKNIFLVFQAIMNEECEESYFY